MRQLTANIDSEATTTFNRCSSARPENSQTLNIPQLREKIPQICLKGSTLRRCTYSGAEK
jgi:hypothetical protein